MLVLHPSSRCDVCLEPYSQDSLARSPHAIPCGHVFCRTCLLAIIPPNCPLCRKPYLPDRVKKLVVDKLEDMDDQLQGDSKRENELLRRLVVCWDESDERLVDLTREVDLWLKGRTDSHPALKKARNALAEYQKLKSRRERDKLVIKALKERERVSSAERDHIQMMEESLTAHISELEMKLAESETYRQELQTQVARHKLRNPLPQPPEIPLPLDQLAATPRLPRSTSLYTVPEVGPSTRRESHNIQPDPRYQNLTPFYAPNPSSQQPPQPHLTESERDRKGKRRALETNGRHSSASIYGKPHPFVPPNTHPNGILSDDERSVIVPGAVTQRRVIPPKEVTVSNTPFPPSDESEDSFVPDRPEGTDSGASLNPYSLATLYIGEYMNGYGEGYNAATSELTPNAQPVRASEPGPRWIPQRGEGTPRGAWGQSTTSLPRSANDPHSFTAEHGPWQGARAADPGNDSSEERLVYNVNGRERRSSTSHAGNADNNSNYAESGHVADPSVSLVRRSHVNGSQSRIQRPQRRRTTGFTPGHETDVESVRRTRDDFVLPPTQRPNSVSVPSWNVHPPIATTATTIATASNMNRMRPRERQNTGSGLSELGLTSFGPESMYSSPPGDTPRSTLSSLGLHTFPLREDDEIVMERLPSASSGSGSGPDSTPVVGTLQQRTPRQRERHVSFDHRPTFISGGGSTAPVGLGQATSSATLNESTNSSRNTQRRATRPTTSHEYATHGRGSVSSSARSSSSALVPTSAVLAPPAVTFLNSPTAVEDAAHLAAAEMPRPLPTTPPRARNALGLQLDAGERTNTPSGGISAPMPIVSAGLFLRSWSMGD